MTLYIGSIEVTPSIITNNGGSGGDTIIASNNTGSAIITGSKVWINENENENNYNIINYYSDKPNFDAIGSPTITNGIASGFTSSKYIKLPLTFVPGNNWEINLKFKTSSTISTGNILSSYGSFSLNKNSICIGINNNRLVYLFSSSGSTYEIAGTLLDPIQVNTLYNVCIKYDNSLGGYQTFINGLQIGSLISGNNLYNNSTLVLGNDRGSSLPFNGSIYLHDCYIKINNTSWWISYMNNIDIDTYSGIAIDNIAPNSNGRVKTVLD